MQGLAILKASLSLESKAVLTHVFLHGNSNNKAVSTPIVGTSSGYQDNAREPRSRKPSSRVFGKAWSNDS